MLVLGQPGLHGKIPFSKLFAVESQISHSTPVPGVLGVGFSSGWWWGSSEGFAAYNWVSLEFLQGLDFPREKLGGKMALSTALGCALSLAAQLQILLRWPLSDIPKAPSTPDGACTGL